MGTLWIRTVKATFTGDGGGLVVERLRIAFNVSKSLSGTPNTAQISIWNLSQENRLKIKKEFDKVRLEAGHVEAGNRGIIFEGNVRDVTHKREGPDIITTAECGDGDKGIRTGTIAKTFPKGAKPKEMIDELLKNMPDVDRGVIQGLDDLPAYPRAVTMFGMASREMDKIGRTHKLYWSVQDGALEVIPGDSFIDDVVVISQTSGMIGVPEITDNGIKVTCLLNPQIRIGRVVEVRSQTLEMNEGEGRFRVSALEFSGDTRANTYECTVHGERIDGGKVTEE
jgi:hypothetical protein